MGTDGGSKKTVDDMEGLSMQTCTIKEEWMDLEDLDFDVVVDVFNNNNSDNSEKGFQRQQSFLDILTDLTDYKDEEQGIDRAETAIYSDSTFINNASSLTGYSYYSPPSPSDSCFSTEGFPEEIHQINQLLPFELPFERVNQLDEQVATSIDLEVTNKTEEGSEEQMEEHSDSDEDYVHEEYSILKMKSRRKSRALQDTFKNNDDAFDDAHEDSSDPDFDPEDFEEVRPPTKRSQRNRKERNVQTSDYESEELSEEERPASRRSRRPSKNPVHQQRKKGSTLKISQWIVELLRNRETNPSVILWEDEPAGKFRVVDSHAFAQLWAKVKKNPRMNYEKLSRAMRYYYRNKEIEMVKGERLTYKFGPNMRDFRAKNRNDPNFQRN